MYIILHVHYITCTLHYMYTSPNVSKTDELKNTYKILAKGWGKTDLLEDVALGGG